MKKFFFNNWKLLLIFSIIIFIFSISFFMFTKLSYVNFLEIEKENISLSNEIENVKKALEETTKNNENKEKELKEKYSLFKDDFGFDYDEHIENLTNKELNNYIVENKNILKELNLLINDYKPYYDGSYFEEDIYTNFLIKVNDIISEDPSEKYSKDLYDYLEIEKLSSLITQDGTINYLKKLNRDYDTKEFNILAAHLVLYFEKLNELTHEEVGIKNNLNNTYKDIYSLLHAYDLAVKKGLNLGELNIDALINMESKSKHLISQYYKNEFIINSFKRKEV